MRILIVGESIRSGDIILTEIARTLPRKVKKYIRHKQEMELINGDIVIFRSQNSACLDGYKPDVVVDHCDRLLLMGMVEFWELSELIGHIASLDEEAQA